MRQDSDSAMLALRVAEFKSDPEKFAEVSRFVDELIAAAETRADNKRRGNTVTIIVEDEKRPPDENGSAEARRRLGSRARGLVARVFDMLCNCSQQAAAAARAHTQQFRAARR